ncbi:uncharacterized protein LJ206_007778 [Theristicus caerulescens]
MGQANCCCGSREALSEAEAVLSADVRLTRGRKRSERRLLLLQEELVIAKLQRGTTLRPQLRLALDQLWVLSGGKEAVGQEEEEEQDGSDEDRTSLILAWPTGSWVATFGTPEGAKRARLTRLPSIKALEKELSRRHADLLAVLHQQGPTTEGVFRRAASATACRELREALDCGADVDLGSQPALLLAVILKDFLRSIPTKLLLTHLYDDWMQAMERTSKQAKVEELKAVAEKLPAANLLLLKRLLSLLQHIGHNVSTSRMTSSNLAICLGPNLLSPPNEDLLPLEAMLEVTQKVNVLLEFLIENCDDIFAEEMPGLSCPSAEASPAPRDKSTVGAKSHQCQQDGAVLARSSAGRRQGLAKQLSSGTDTSTPLPILAVAAWAASLVHGEGPPVPGGMGQANCCCGSREALSEAEAVLSADVRLTRGRKRSERRLLLLQEELVIAKLQRGTTLRPQLRLALDQLWVLSGGKEAVGQEEEEEQDGSDEDRTSLILAWPTGSWVATFG